jgi:hypothetical protein
MERLEAGGADVPGSGVRPDAEVDLASPAQVTSSLSYVDLDDVQRACVYDLATAVAGGSQVQHMIIGAGGSGKTALVRFLLSLLVSAGYKCGVVAPSGAAACLYPTGMTIHSFCGLQCDMKVRSGDRSTVNRRIEELDFLFVDECGMILDSLSGQMERVFQAARGNRLPWGGVHVVFTGDPLQLPPVVDDDQEVGASHSGDPFWCSKRARDDFSHFILERNHRVVGSGGDSDDDDDETVSVTEWVEFLSDMRCGRRWNAETLRKMHQNLFWAVG